MDELDVYDGDLVLVKGNKQTVLIALVSKSILTDHDTIIMNDTAAENVGCKYGDQVVIGSPGAIPYGTAIILRPLETGNVDVDKFMNDYLIDYFQDFCSYRPVRIGDSYRIKHRMDNTYATFEVVDVVQSFGSVLGSFGNETPPNICVVCPETQIVVVNDAEANETGKINHKYPPTISLSLHSLPLTVNWAKLEFEIKIKELNQSHSSKFVFSNDSSEYIFAMNTLYAKNYYQWKNMDRMSFELNIKSVKLYDLNGN
eukprot:135002_1